ncbi:MAG: VWA domain-containing protein [Spirochaetota bacterium]
MRLLFYVLVTFFILSCSSGSPRSYLEQTQQAYYFARYPSYLQTLSSKAQSKYHFPLTIKTYSLSHLLLAQERGLEVSLHNLHLEELISAVSQYQVLDTSKKLHFYTELVDSPWNPRAKLIQLGVYSKKFISKSVKKSKAKHIIFVVDVSGSMSGSIQHVKESMLRVLQTLGEGDSVSLVRFNDTADIVFSNIAKKETWSIERDINGQFVSGGTNAWSGIQLAYQVAKQFARSGQNTELLFLTDGDFGGINWKELQALLAKNQRDSKLSVISFGNRDNGIMQNLQQERLAQCFYVANSEEVMLLLSQLQLGEVLEANIEKLAVNLTFLKQAVQSYRFIGFGKYRQLKSHNNVVNVYDSLSQTILLEVVPKDKLPPGSTLLQLSASYKAGPAKEVGAEVETLQTQEALVKLRQRSIWQGSENIRFTAGIATLYRANTQSEVYQAIHLMEKSIGSDPKQVKQQLVRIAYDTLERY